MESKEGIHESSIRVGEFSTPVSEIDRSSREESHQRHSWSQQNHQPTGYNWHLWTILSNESRLHILLKAMWTIY